ncbi:MAG: hypothetical protein ACM3SU_08715 [Acidobacteriota bacterium]
MFDRLLPRRIDNTFPGRTPALWLFGLLLLAKAAMSLNSIFNGYAVATSADGIPLDAYTPAAARTVLSLFALLALCQLVMCLLGLLALVRYRAMVPLLFALFLLEFACRRLVLLAMPIARTGRPPGVFVNLALLVVMVLGLALSLWRRGDPGTQ